jgi:hypothetical protein
VPDDLHRLPLQKSAGLVDVLDRILDKGLVVAGDVKISLADVELLTIRIRLIVCSVDKAEKIGMDWWRADPYFSSYARRYAALPPGSADPAEVAEASRDATHALESKIEELDAKLTRLLNQSSPAAPPPPEGPRP